MKLYFSITTPNLGPWDASSFVTSTNDQKRHSFLYLLKCQSVPKDSATEVCLFQAAAFFSSSSDCCCVTFPSLSAAIKSQAVVQLYLAASHFETRPRIFRGEKQQSTLLLYWSRFLSYRNFTWIFIFGWLFTSTPYIFTQKPILLT